MKTTLTRNEKILAKAFEIIVAIIAFFATVITMIIFSPVIIWQWARYHKDQVVNSLVVIMLSAIFVTAMIVLPLIFGKP